MASYEDITLPLESESYYHIYNRGNNKDLIFFQDRNYYFFWKRYRQYLDSFIDTYAYCLLPNHFHLLIRVKEINEFLYSFKNKFQVWPTRLRQKFGNIDLPDLQDLEDLPPTLKPIITEWLVSEQFRRFFLSYSKAINKQEGREGSLMQKNFRRKRIDKLAYLTQVIWYIHRNPVHHGVWNNYKDYPWSSFPLIEENKGQGLALKEIFELFDGKTNFLKFHATKMHDWKIAKRYIIEDEEVF